MDKKVICDKQRKRTKEFKRRRNQLSQQQNSQTLRRVANEGITYESSAGLNLDISNNRTAPQIAFDVPTELSKTELRRYEKILPPYTARPKVIDLSYDSTQKYQFIIFDTETTCTGKQAEKCQLSAVNENGRHEFSTFILLLLKIPVSPVFPMQLKTCSTWIDARNGCLENSDLENSDLRP